MENEQKQKSIDAQERAAEKIIQSEEAKKQRDEAAHKRQEAKKRKDSERELKKTQRELAKQEKEKQRREKPNKKSNKKKEAEEAPSLSSNNENQMPSPSDLKPSSSSIPTSCFVCYCSFENCKQKETWKVCEECPNWCCYLCLEVGLSKFDICYECLES